MGWKGAWRIAGSPAGPQTTGRSAGTPGRSPVYPSGPCEGNLAGPDKTPRAADEQPCPLVLHPLAVFAKRGGGCRGVPPDRGSGGGRGGLTPSLAATKSAR